MLQQFDFVIICAKVAEVKAVVTVIDSRTEFKRISGDDFGLRIYEINGAKRIYTLLITQCADMGHADAAIRAAQVIALHQPGMIFFVGTAASIDSTEVQIGDVVIPKRTVFRMYEKITEKGSSEYEERAAHPHFKEYFFDDTALIADTKFSEASVNALTASIAASKQTENLYSGQNNEIEIFGHSIKLRPSKIHDDLDILTTGMVVDSTNYLKHLRNIAGASFRKVGAIDMESYGFYRAISSAINSFPSTTTIGLMVRGISDYAGRKKDFEKLPDDWRAVAVKNAAIVSVGIISDLISPPSQ